MKKLLCALLIFLVGCSGGGGESSNDNTAQANQITDTVIEKKEIIQPEFISKLQSGIPQTIVIMGTSLSAAGSWAVLFERKMSVYPVTIINFANGGQDSSYGVEIIQQVLDSKPDVVFIEYSMNDALTERDMTVSESYVNLDTIVKAILKEYPECEIILQTMNLAYGLPGESRPNLEAYYQIYRDYAKTYGLFLIDYCLAWEEAFNANPDLIREYIPDGVHPVKKGLNAVVMPFWN